MKLACVCLSSIKLALVLVNFFINYHASDVSVAITTPELEQNTEENFDIFLL
jgi:hypothetical protein